MKYKIYQTSVLLVAILIIGTGFITKEGYDLSSYSTEGLELYYHVPNEDEILHYPTTLNPQFHLFLGKSYLGFKEALGFRESRGNYQIVNDYGYLGKYQFSRATLRGMGMKNTHDFLEDTRKQEEAFFAYTAMNKWVLRKYIERYSGKVVGGVKVTESGILAAAHLAGPGNVRKFLRSGGTNVFSDANGTSVAHYMRSFSGYDTSHIKANRKPKLM